MTTHRDTVVSYTKNANKFDDLVTGSNASPYHKHYEKPAMLAELPNIKNLDILCVGCGNGAETNWFLENGAHRTVGVDISKGLIDIAKERYPKAEFYEMDMEKIDFPEESFDFAYSSLTLHYADDWKKTLTETKAVLKKGGLYIFSCFHPIDSAMTYDFIDDIEYARIGRGLERNVNYRVVYGDYMAKEGGGVKERNRSLSGIDVVIYHRTLGKMFEQIQSSGFKIKKFVEPLPVKELKSVDPKLYEQLNRVPAFIIWVLEKE